MAKCPVCNSRKGKRECQINSHNLICSLCCGQTRNDSCKGCDFFEPVKTFRGYDDVPRFSIEAMSNDISLNSDSAVIEGSLCAYDIATDQVMNDKDAIKIYELLLDKYHFKNSDLSFPDEITKNGFLHIDSAIKKELSQNSHEEIVKLIGVIRFTAKRRGEIGRDYLEFIKGYVGPRLASGLQILPKGFFGKK